MKDSSTSAIVAANLRSAMARQRRKQSDLATLLGVSQAAVSRRLSGETPLHVDELVAIASWLGVPPMSLLFDADTFRPAVPGRSALMAV